MVAAWRMRKEVYSIVTVIWLNRLSGFFHYNSDTNYNNVQSVYLRTSDQWQRQVPLYHHIPLPIRLPCSFFIQSSSRPPWAISKSVSVHHQPSSSFNLTGVHYRSSSGRKKPRRLVETLSRWSFEFLSAFVERWLISVLFASLIM